MDHVKIVATNKKAYHDYYIEDTYECGLVLTGTEIKSVRRGKVQLRDSFGRIRNGEVFVWNMHIAEYTEGNIFNHEPTRTRKLLLNKKEIRKLIDIVNQDGYTLIPTKVYLKNGRAKLELQKLCNRWMVTCNMLLHQQLPIIIH